MTIEFDSNLVLSKKERKRRTCFRPALQSKQELQTNSTRDENVSS
jgi:hypothetical protein